MNIRKGIFIWQVVKSCQISNTFVKRLKNLKKTLRFIPVRSAYLKSMKRRDVLLILLVTTLISLYSSPLSFATSQQPLSPIVINGLLDLRKADFSKKEYTLNGYWKLYWLQMRKPGDAPGEFEYVKFPELWNDMMWKGSPLPASGYGTYEATIILPHHEKNALALRMPDCYTSYRLYVNGNLSANNGSPGTTKETTQPDWFHVITPMMKVGNLENEMQGVIF